MRQIIKKSKKFNILLIWLFFISVFTFRIPNFYLIFAVRNTFLTSQAVARIIIFLIFTIKIAQYLEENRGFSFLNKKNFITTFFICALFFFQSISIISSMNLYSFLERYKDIVLGFVAFFTFAFYTKEEKKFIFIFTIPIFINLLYQTVMVVNVSRFVSFANSIIYSRHFEFVEFNINRGRIYIDSYDEAFIPFLFLNANPFINYVTAMVLAFFALSSNFRTRIIMFGFSIVGSFLLVLRKTKNLLIILVLVLLLSPLVNYFSIERLGFSFYDRFLFEGNTIEREIISSRLSQLITSLDVGWFSFFGLGLGNFYDNLPTIVKTGALPLNVVEQGALGYVHNIFGSIIAESGYFSVLIFIVILISFINIDIRHIKGINKYKKTLVVCFWTLFIYNLFNPNVAASYQVFFWGIRGLLLQEY